MQTFLPYASYIESAGVLDNRRLNKQITECMQILMALTGQTTAWYNHDVTRMWKGYELSLAEYGFDCYVEWQKRLHNGLRGGVSKHNAGKWIEKFIATEVWVNNTFYQYPHWLGNEQIHSAYRAVLLAKKPAWYARYNWQEEPAIMINGRWPYVYPV